MNCDHFIWALTLFSLQSPLWDISCAQISNSKSPRVEDAQPVPSGLNRKGLCLSNSVCKCHPKMSLKQSTDPDQGVTGDRKGPELRGLILGFSSPQPALAGTTGEEVNPKAQSWFSQLSSMVHTRMTWEYLLQQPSHKANTMILVKTYFQRINTIDV